MSTSDREDEKGPTYRAVSQAPSAAPGLLSPQSFVCEFPSNDAEKVRVDEIGGHLRISRARRVGPLTVGTYAGGRLDLEITDVPQLIEALTKALKHYTDGAQARVRTALN
jgi:hypothetical protein